MTWYEAIKQMSLEEMADKFEMREFFAVAYNGTHEGEHQFAIDWLKSEYIPPKAE